MAEPLAHAPARTRESHRIRPESRTHKQKRA
jgi:hypothetical protein